MHDVRSASAEDVRVGRERLEKVLSEYSLAVRAAEQAKRKWQRRDARVGELWAAVIEVALGE